MGAQSSTEARPRGVAQHRTGMLMLIDRAGDAWDRAAWRLWYAWRRLRWLARNMNRPRRSTLNC